MRSRWRAALWLLAGAAAAQAARAQDAAEPFRVQEVAIAGRVVAAEIADLDGDGRSELWTTAVRGVWPDETREMLVFASDADGTLSSQPSWRAPLPAAAATYDVADLDGRPGREVLLLERDGVRVLARRDGEIRWRQILVPTPPTIAIRPDERGLDRLRLVRPELGAGRLLVPGLDEAWVLGADGRAVSRLRIGGRANYFVPVRPGPEIGENEVELFFDVPTLQTGDLDGDARVDVIATNRHALRIFRQREDGSFGPDPDPALALRLVPLEDQVRNSGSVRTEVRDLDADGRADLLLSHTSGGLMRAANQTRIHLNRDGRFDLSKPDQVLERRGGVAADEIVDLDGDGRPEWLRVFLPFGLLQLAELFLQRSVDLEASIHRPAGDGVYEDEPWVVRRLAIPFDFETLRPRGFPPTLSVDWNGDGRRDLISSASGSAIEIWLGSAERPFERPAARQSLDSVGRMRTGDLDGDGLPDWVLYDPRRPDVPVRVGVNRGQLPGTRPMMQGR